MAVHKTLFLIAALTVLASACVWAADDPFVGTWKMNQDKSQVAGTEQSEIKALGGHKYDWAFGDVDMTIVADGADHPYKFGGTWSITQEGPDKWISTHKHNGQVTSVETWTLTDGGQQWNVEEKGTHADGSTYTESQTIVRIGPGTGFVGKWELKSAKASSYPDFVIYPYGEDGLSFTTPANKRHLDIKFDGNNYPDHGPGVSPGSTASAKRIEAHTIQMTVSLKGKVISKRELKVSDDGMTLTDTVHLPGEQKPVIFAYDKKM